MCSTSTHDIVLLVKNDIMYLCQIKSLSEILYLCNINSREDLLQTPIQKISQNYQWTIETFGRISFDLKFIILWFKILSL